MRHEKYPAVRRRYISETRLHSSRMRTVRNSSRLPRGVSAPGGGLLLGVGACSEGVPAPGGCGIPACTEADPHLCGQNQRQV